MSPGYGLPQTRVTPELSVSRYQPQLIALGEAVARAGGGGSLRTRQALIRDSLQEAGIESLPARPDGQHVVADLLSFYLGRSEARDLCYEADIGRYTCPGLSGLSEKPAPWTPGSRSAA